MDDLRARRLEGMFMGRKVLSIKGEPISGEVVDVTTDYTSTPILLIRCAQNFHHIPLAADIIFEPLPSPDAEE